MAVDRRLWRLRHLSNEATLRSSTARWRPAEILTLRNRLQQGLDPPGIVECLPDRSIDAVAEYIKKLNPGDAKAVHEFSDAQVKRAIEMKLTELKSSRQVAAELGCSVRSAWTLWEKRISGTLSQKELDAIRRHNHNKTWSAKEEQRLKELFVPTKLSRTEVALQFPRKTNNAVSNKITAIGLPAARKKYWAELR